MTIFRYSIALAALPLSSCAQQPTATEVGNEDEPGGRLVPIENVLPPIGNAEQFNQLGSEVILPDATSEHDATLDRRQRDYEMSKMRRHVDAVEDRQRQLEIEQRRH